MAVNYWRQRLALAPALVQLDAAVRRSDAPGGPATQRENGRRG